jgi:hypothetical protein
MSNNKLGEIIFLICCMIFIVIYFFVDIAPLSKNILIKSYVLAIMAITTVLILFQIVKLSIFDKNDDKKPGVSTGIKENLGQLIKSKLVILLLMIFVYIALIPYVGFFSMTFVFILGTLWFLGYRSKLFIILIPTIYSLVTYYIFTKYLEVKFTSGLFY